MKLEDREDALLEELRFCDINENILNAMKKIKRYLFVFFSNKQFFFLLMQHFYFS